MYFLFSSSFLVCLQFLSTLYKEVADREGSGDSPKLGFVKKLIHSSLHTGLHLSEESIASKLASL